MTHQDKLVRIIVRSEVSAAGSPVMTIELIDAGVKVTYTTHIWDASPIVPNPNHSTFKTQEAFDVPMTGVDDESSFKHDHIRQTRIKFESMI